jgi:acyl-CoA thioester hydrolase
MIHNKVMDLRQDKFLQMNKLEKDSSLVLYQDVIWGDADAFGHVNNTVYFRYFEDVRIAYFVKTGVLETKETLNLGPILATTQCDFKLPLTYPDRIHIGCKAMITGPKKVLMEYTIFSERFNEVAATGSSLVIFYDYNNSCSCEIPEQVSAAIKTYAHS